MSQRCCVPGCVNSSENNMHLHKFPNPEKYKELFNTWLYSIGGDILQLENSHIFKYRRVCHVHFESKYWCRNNRVSKHAVPTQNMPGLLSSKFNTGTRVLRTLQMAEASTSKNPVAPLLYSQEVEDVQMKENIDPVAPVLYSQEVEDVQMKENIDPVAPVLYLQEVEDVQMKENIDPVAPLLYSQEVEDVQMKENIDPVAPLLYSQEVEDVQMKENIEPNTSHLESAAIPIPIAQTQGSTRTGRMQFVKRVAVTDSELALYKKLRLVGVKLSKCRSKIKSQAKKMKVLQNITTNPQFLQTLDKLSSTSKILTLLQFREHKKGDKGRRFTLEEKIVALTILKQSPKGYRFLRKIFILPSRQTLLKLINMADINAGINKNMMQQIKRAAKNMKIEDKLCIVMFDEMSLKPNLAYNERKDKVCGFVTCGQGTLPEYADHAQVFMIRGLIKNYKQPVAYTFSQAATKGPELANQLKKIITELQNTGLIVVATVCDQGTNNVNAIKYLLQETRGTLLRKGEEPRENIIIINNQDVIPLYDPPHLMKCIRNNLITKNLRYEHNQQSKVAKWEHILALHKENPGYKGIRLVPKLTDSHCDPCKIPKMKVKFATQLFSQTVASNMGYLADKGIIPEEAKNTADLLLIFDQLFDSVNGSYGKIKKHGKPLLKPVTPTSIHHKVWMESIQLLKKMKFINKKTCSIEYVPTLNNWVWTLEGIQLLINKMSTKYGVKSIWLRHLNQDPIENFFGSIRSHGCRNVNPTPENFEAAFATLLINSLSSVHAPGANCEIDDCYALHKVLITGGDSKDQSNLSLENIPDITFTPLEEKNDPRKVGGLQYVSGYFVKNAKKKVFKGCDECKVSLMTNNEPEYLRYREYANKKWLCSPSDSLLNCISNLQDINYAIIKENLHKKYIKELIKTIILIHVDFDFITCLIHKESIIDFLIKISCRFFIHNYCKDINKILINKRDCDDETDFYKIKAHKLFKKCFKTKNK